MNKTWMTHRQSAPPQTRGDGREGRGVRGALLREQTQPQVVSPPAAASSQDPMDAAREREDEAVRLAVLRRRQELDTTLKEILQSLATGQYGRCIECGRHIALARLRAMPLAIRCLACQERFEQAARIAKARESRCRVQDLQEVAL
jgi:DnaK suppressor protein